MPRLTATPLRGPPAAGGVSCRRCPTSIEAPSIGVAGQLVAAERGTPGLAMGYWRPFLIPCLVLVLELGLTCKHEPPVFDATKEKTYRGISFLRIFTHGGDEASPLIIALHGAGADPEDLAGAWYGFPQKAEIALPRGFFKLGDGWSWVDPTGKMSADELARAFRLADERLWPAIADIARGRKVIVSGFSQGAVLAYLLATRHPDAIVYAFPISGWLLPSMLPRSRTPIAPVYALHGTDDQQMDIQRARLTIAAFKESGATAELREFPGVGHTITMGMLDDLWAHVKSAIGQASR